MFAERDLGKWVAAYEGASFGKGIDLSATLRLTFVMDNDGDLVMLHPIAGCEISKRRDMTGVRTSVPGTAAHGPCWVR